MRKVNYLDVNTTVRVVIYARVSTEHEEQLSALENQIQYYDNIINQHPNWQLVERYIDKGITGTSIKKRPAFLKMLEDAELNKFDLIITREISRFARNTVDTLQQTRSLMEIGIGVYFTEDNIWTMNDEDEELRLTIMATLAQNESKKISVRVKAGQKISYQNGVFYGNGNILGYDRVGKDMIINPEQAATVRKIFDLYLSGVGTRKIQDILETEGHKTAMGKTNWTSAVILRIIRNSFYCGLITYNKEFVSDYLTQKKKKNKGEVEQVTVQGTHEPIITKEEFEEAQKILNSRSRKVDNRKVGHAVSKDVYARKLICQCGKTFNRRITYTTKSGEKHYIYQCYHQLRHGTVKHRKKKGLPIEDTCTSMCITSWKLETVADWLFRKFLSNKQEIYDRTMEMIEEALNYDESVDDIQEQLEQLNESINKQEKKLSVIVDLFADGDISKDMYLKKKADSEQLIEKYKNEIDALIEKQEKALEGKNIDNRKKAIVDLLAIEPFKQERRIPDEIIDRYVERIEVSDTHMNWVLRIPGHDNQNVSVTTLDNKTNNGITPSTLDKNYVLCTTQHRQRLAQDVVNSTTSVSSKNPVKLGVYVISSNYVRQIKKFYSDEIRVARDENFEVQVSILST